MLEWWTKNFASCQLGDERLSNRAFWIDDFPEFTVEDIRACLEFVADRERRLVAVVGAD